MRPTFVVGRNGLPDRRHGLRFAPEGLAESVFLFEYAGDALGLGVFVAVVDLGHADGTLPPLQRSDVVLAAILCAAIRMMDWVRPFR